MTDINSTVVDVTVFPDRARVTRRGTLPLAIGTHRIDFNDIPLSLMPESVRAAGRGTALASLLGVDTRRTYFAETPSVRIHELEQQIERLNDQDKELADRAAAAEVQATFIKNLADQSAEQFARGLAWGRAQMSQGETLLSFMQQQLAQAQATVREINQQRRELARQLTKLTNELNDNRSARPRERYTATVEVEVKQGGDLTLELTYMLSNAAWSALYDIRFGEGEKPSLQVAYLAQVMQNTGEDWNDVSLTLSTARPALASVKPELEPWYLSPYAPPPPAMRRVAMAAPTAPAAQAGVEAFEAITPAPQMAMEVPSAQVDAQAASVTFKLAQPVSIPSDGSPHKVNVATLELPPQLDYITLPKLAEAAYRRVKLTNRSDFLLLPGQANLFVGGDFVGTQSFERIAPNEEFDLTLGVDDRVYVKRELKAREVDKKFLADRRRLKVGYELEIRNLRPGKISLEVRDQIPVSRHEQVKVKLESADPRPREQTELNELEWRLELEPGAKQLIRFDFSVEYPTSMTVIGLP